MQDFVVVVHQYVPMIHIHDNRVIEDHAKIGGYFGGQGAPIRAHKETGWKWNFLTRKTRDARQCHDLIRTTVASEKIFLRFNGDLELELILFLPCRSNVMHSFRCTRGHVVECIFV